MPSMLSDAFRAHPFHLKHQDFTSFQELPESYTWTQLDEEKPEKPLGPAEQVPVIDMDDLEAAAAGIGHACKTWGVFQITNHRVPRGLLDQVDGLTGELFSLPADRKLRAARQPEGMSGYGLARISSFFSKLMWSEGFTIADSPREHFAKLWPDDYHRYCDVIGAYEEEMKKLAGRLMWLMLGSVGVTQEDISWAGEGDGDGGGSFGALQLNHYPACPDPERAMGLAPHTDSTLLTVLYQNSTPGLEIYREGVGWITVPPLQDSLVVHVGDLLHILSNGRFPSVLHRARVNRERARLSVAYLYGPPVSVEISPVMKLVTPVQPPLYRPVTWKEYLGAKAMHFDKALSSVSTCVPPMGLLELNDRSSVQVG